MIHHTAEFQGISYNFITGFGLHLPLGSLIIIDANNEGKVSLIENVLYKDEKNENMNLRGINPDFIYHVESFCDVRHVFEKFRCEKEKKIMTIYILKVINLMKKRANLDFKDLVVSDDYLWSLQRIFNEICLYIVVSSEFEKCRYERRVFHIVISSEYKNWRYVVDTTFVE